MSFLKKKFGTIWILLLLCNFDIEEDMEVDLTEETNSDDKIDYSVAFTEDIADIDDIEDFYGDNYDDITLAD